MRNCCSWEERRGPGEFIFAKISWPIWTDSVSQARLYLLITLQFAQLLQEVWIAKLMRPRRLSYYPIVSKASSAKSEFVWQQTM
jgi:hypothetical protein